MLATVTRDGERGHAVGPTPDFAANTIEAMTRALLASLPDRLREPAFDGTGGLSSELVQKAAVAGAPILVGVGAPTSLAFELASDRGLTLAGFARNGRISVYAGTDRICG
jgi:formate dehydrogenase assembly factor FdhD